MTPSNMNIHCKNYIGMKVDVARNDAKSNGYELATAHKKLNTGFIFAQNPRTDRVNGYHDDNDVIVEMVGVF